PNPTHANAGGPSCRNENAKATVGPRPWCISCKCSRDGPHGLWTRLRSRQRRRSVEAVSRAAKAEGGAAPCAGGLDGAVARGGRREKRGEQLPRHLGSAADGVREGRLVRPRGPGEAGELAHELECGRADLVVGDGRLEVEERLDVSAHANGLPASNERYGAPAREAAPSGGRRPWARGDASEETVDAALPGG